MRTVRVFMLFYLRDNKTCTTVLIVILWLCRSMEWILSVSTTSVIAIFPGNLCLSPIYVIQAAAENCKQDLHLCLLRIC